MSVKRSLWRVAPWLAVAWILTVSFRYVSTILKSYGAPLNPGDDFEWIIVWFALVVAVFLSACFGQKALRAWAVAVFVITLAILVLSHVWVAAILAAWIVMVSILVGCSVLRVLGISGNVDLDEQIVLAFPLGISALSLLVLLIAILHLLSSTLVWATLVAITLLELKNAPALLRRMRDGLAGLMSSGSGEESIVLLPLCGLAFLANLLWSVAPELHFDSLNYHLAVPRLYLEAGGLVDLPYFWHSYFAHLAEMFFAFCMALYSEILAKLMNNGMGVIAALGTYTLGKLVFTPRVGLWAAAFFYTTPLAMWLSGSAYIDLIVALFIVAQVIALLRWRQTHQTAFIWLTGILIGCALALKLNALYAAVGAGFALCGLLLTSREPLRKRAATLLICVMSAIVLALPWYLIVYLHTGNPIFPLMNGVFKSPGASLDNNLMNAATFGVGTSPSALLRLPFRFTFDTIRFGEALLRGSAGPLLVFLIPFGFLIGFRKNTDARILCIVAATYLFLWAETFQYGRYYMAMMPAITVLAIAGVYWASPTVLADRINRAALAVLLVLQVSILPMHFWNIPDRFPLRLALGLESRERFLKRSLYGYRAVMHINDVVAPDKTVLSPANEELRFYLKPPLESPVETLANSPLQRAFSLPPGPALAQSLLDLGISHILIVGMPPPQTFTAPEFLERYAALDYADNEAAVYRLKVPVSRE